MRSPAILALLLFSANSLAALTLSETFSAVLSGKESLTEATLDQMYTAFQSEYGSLRAQEDRNIDKFLGGSVDRKAIFSETVREVIKHNTDPQNTWEKGINAFSDMTHEEFNRYYGIVKKDQVCTVAPPSIASYDLSALPVNWDWRDFNIVTPVKNQGKCGSCWTFSTVGVIESHFKLKYGIFRNMSE
jgi:C1A family cysteine protease